MMRYVNMSIWALGLLLVACTADNGPDAMSHEGQPELPSAEALGGEIRINVGDTRNKTRIEGATSFDYDYLQQQCSWPGDAQNYFKVDAYMVDDRTKKYIDGSYVLYNTYVTEFPWKFCNAAGVSQPYYWPYTLGFDFFAYAPAMVGGVPQEPTIAANGVTYDGFDAVENKHTLSCDLENFRYGDQEGLTEFIYAYETDQTYATHGQSGVTLHFQHPLAAVIIRLSSAFEALKLNTVTFTSTDLGTGKGQGIYHQGTGTCSTDGTTWVKPETAVASDFTIFFNKIMNESMFIGNIYEKPFLVMPQSLIDRDGLEDVVIQIKFQKKLNETEYDAEKTVTLPITDKITSWEAGKAYVYSLELGKDESIIIGASVEPWNYQGDHTIVPIDKDE